MNNFTSAQLKVIETWTEQRDALLREISALTIERDALFKKNTESSAAFTELQGRIDESKGRLSEISALEERWRVSLASDISALEVRKSQLQGEVLLEEEKLKALVKNNETMTSSNETISASLGLFVDQRNEISGLLGEIIEKTNTHLKEMSDTVLEIKTVATEVIDKGNENVKQTDIVLGQLPRFIFELQKPIPVRRYSEARGKDQIDPARITEVREANAKINELI